MPERCTERFITVISGQQGVSGTYPNLSFGILAFWICIKEISSTGMISSQKGWKDLGI